MLSENTIQRILECQKEYPEKRSALIPALHMAQSEVGYLPQEVQEEIARLFNISANEVNSVVTFYDMFFEEPVGDHIIHICKNISCMLRGCDELMQKVCERLQIKPGETTHDKAFTVIASECLGACDKAPMMLVDKNVVGPVKESDLDSILEEAKKGPKHPSPTDVCEGCHG
jgi:NADH-quinone oxidoreductase subunit E